MGTIAPIPRYAKNTFLQNNAPHFFIFFIEPCSGRGGVTATIQGLGVPPCKTNSWLRLYDFVHSGEIRLSMYTFVRICEIVGTETDRQTDDTDRR